MLETKSERVTIAKLLLCGLLSFALISCQNFKPLKPLKMPGRETVPEAKQDQSDQPMTNAPPENRDEIDLGGASGTNSEPVEKMQTGTGQFIKPPATPTPGARSALADQEVSFNFEATPVPEVVKTILGDLLQETYVIAPGVGGTVTFATARPIKGEQAMAVLEMLLSWSGAALVKKGDSYLVVQTQAAVPGNLSPQVGPLGEARGFDVRAVPLKFISATQMEELLKPYAKQGSVLKADNARSLIVLAGTKSELENYLSVVDTFDVDWMAGMSFGLFSLERVEVKDLMPELEAIFGEGGGAPSAAAGSSPLAGMVRLLPIERLNSILVITPQPSYLGQVEKWIKKLDRGGTQGGAKLFVYDVKNVKATDLADRLNEIFNGQTAAPRQTTERNRGLGQVAPGLGGSTIGSQGFGAGVNRPVMPTPQPTSASANPAAAGSGQSILGSQELRITAIEDNNALLVSATPAQYDILKSAIRRLDIEPLQVKIEAKLLQVELSNNLQMGVQWWLEGAVAPNAGDQTGGGTGNPPAGGTGSGTGTTTGNGLQIFASPGNTRLAHFSGVGGIASEAGVNYLFDGPNARALVTALQAEGDAKILSSPTLLVLNNKEATINVGQQIQQSIGSSNFGGVGGTQTLFQPRDTGITLTVTPRVNPGGLVYLEIQSEDSAPGREVNGQASISQKSIQTEVAVQSGQTIMLGGLITQDESNSNGGIPGLKNLPILGRVFGASKKSVNRKETLVLITPTVVNGGAEEMREVTDEYVRQFKGLQPLIDTGVIPPAPIRRNELQTPEKTDQKPN